MKIKRKIKILSKIFESMEEAEKILMIEALKNAVKFEGTANFKAVFGKLMKDMPEFRTKSKEIKPIAEKIVNDINSWDTEKQKTELLKLDPNALDEKKTKPAEEKSLPDLPNAIIGDKKNPVVMRLAPYPSGALHIGNARMIVLNDEYVKKYKGKLILCFDDTIGTTKEKYDNDREKAKFVIPEAYDLILQGLDWLGVKYDKKNIKYKSERVAIYKKYAEQLIEDQNAYVCDCSAADFREKYKKTGEECPCRNLSSEIQIDRWNKMLDGTYGEGDAVVRLKTGMDQKDPAVRDHIIMRISDATHPKIGNTIRVWPLLDFSWAIDDYEFGVTHIIRGIDLQKEGFIENFIWDLMGWRKAEILLYGRMKFSKDFKLSKTEARVNIENNIYDGWDDPRTWSLQSLEKRGIRADALRKSLIDLGMSNRAVNFSEDWIYSANSKLIDEKANRYWFVQDPIEIKIKGLDKKEYISTPLLNPNNEKLGNRSVILKVKDGNSSVYISKLDTEKQINNKGNKVRYPAMSKGDSFRFKDLFTIELDTVDIEKNLITAHFLTEETDQKIRKIQWVPKNDFCQVKVLKPNGIVMDGFAESNVLNLKQSDIIQFERYGFVKIQKIDKNSLYCYFTQ